MILLGTRWNRLELGARLGADATVNVREENAVAAVKRLTGGRGLTWRSKARARRRRRSSAWRS